MSLNITTDYAIRIMMYLANYYDPDPLFAPDGNCSGKIIAEKMNIPYNYFLKIVPRLKDAGYLLSFQGKRGGYVLTTPPEAITLYDIIHVMDDDFILNACTAPDGLCQRDNTPDYCSVHYVLSDVQNTIDNTLKSVNLAELAEQEKARFHDK
ncbi:MAG: Rrf2 family transcriptional regulator [Peptococcaceae bacterium]|nr:Rrf2 family transcriptional regulator [Peptococcaceae bacterium]